MTDKKSAVAALRRPRLLVRAARHGLIDYDRSRDLSRLTGQSSKRDSSALLSNLMAQEAQIEATREARDASYSIARHIEILVALMAECQFLSRNQSA